MNKKMTNINITGQDHTFQYLVEYINGEDSSFPSYNIMWRKSTWNDSIELGEDMNLCRYGSYWGTPNYSDIGNSFIPDTYKKSRLRIYFPSYNLNVFMNAFYVLDINTWIRGKWITLGSYLINMRDVLSCPIINKGENSYSEYVEFDIVDPKYILYSDEWSDFRINLCGEHFEDGYVSNNEGSSLNISLNPVNIDDRGYYITLSEYSGGQNSINISDENYLSLNLKKSYDDNGVIFKTDIIYNDVYENIYEYLRETYNLFGDIVINTSIVISDSDNVYGIKNANTTEDFFIFNRNDLRNINKDIYQNNIFDNWSGYIDGLSIMTIVTIKDGDNEILIRSNKIPLTQDLFSYIVGDNDINKIDLNNEQLIDMKTYNINTVNKIINNVVQMGNPNESKSNLIQPIFFRSRELNNLIIHPAVTENISINLDAYKYKVSSFVLQIEGKTFIEYGRTAAGVIFKVVGPQLPKNNTSGTFYILNENAEVVTTGKYNYVY